MANTEITVVELIEGARKLVGTPFVHQGRSGVGVDCIGFVSEAGLRSGINIAELIGVSDDLSYTKEPSPRLFEITQANCERLREPIPGAALLFQLPKAAYPHHFALYTESNTMIHAEAVRVKKVVEVTFGGPWKKWLHSVWKIPGVRY